MRHSRQLCVKCFQAAGMVFDRKKIFKLPEQWEKCVQRNEDYVEKEAYVNGLR
jgi:hypothetical protein